MKEKKIKIKNQDNGEILLRIPFKIVQNSYGKKRKESKNKITSI